MKIENYRIYYIVALLIIASMTIVSHLLIGLLLRTNNGFAYLINESGRQRMLSQRVASFSMQYYIAHDVAKRQELISTMRTLQNAHRELSSPFKDKDESQNVFELKMQHLYFNSRHAVDAGIQQLNAMVQRLTAPNATKEIQLTEIKKITALVNHKLLTTLNQLVYHYQKESEQRIETLDQIQWILLAIILISLVLEALYIFRPIFKRLSDYVHMLVKVATIDELTNLYNRREFNKRFQEQVDFARRFGQLCSVIALDIDKFKNINDQYGHKVGDKALMEVSKALTAASRRTDFCFRIGGDEFVVLLPHTDMISAKKVAERCQMEIKAAAFNHSTHGAILSVSIGVAMINDKTLESALEQADEAMYQAKQAGGNQVILHDDK